MQLLMDNLATGRNLMAQFNVRLVISIAKHYVGQGVELQDLIQVLLTLVAGLTCTPHQCGCFLRNALEMWWCVLDLHVLPWE